MEDYKTKLRMIPVCNCGYVFRDGVVIYEHIHEINGIKYAKHSIEPSTCPNCRKEIECIETYDYKVKEC